MAFDNDELNKRREERKKEKQFYEAQMRLLKIGMIVTAVTMVVCVAAMLITPPLSAMKSTPSTTKSIAIIRFSFPLIFTPLKNSQVYYMI